MLMLELLCLAVIKHARCGASLLFENAHCILCWVSVIPSFK